LKKNKLPTSIIVGSSIVACALILAGLAMASREGEVAEPPSQPSIDAIQHGAYVARLGDCVACHTTSGGAPMAGGLELSTPMGKMYSTNITPDRKNGIGNYTFAQFDRAMRKGVAADGRNLYPAMPYTSYAKISDEDMRALYAFLMHGVPPVGQPNKAANMKFPFNMRWGLALWNMVFLDNSPFKGDPSKDAVWNRGAYLTQTLGHCGACHTPRGIGFQEKAMTEAGLQGDLYLAGETVEGWRASSLRNLWTVDDTVQILRSGLNRYATAAGSMVEVIHNSTQYFTDDDLVAVATYLKSLPGGQDSVPMPVAPNPAATSSAAAAANSPGAEAYDQYCGDCHHDSGLGTPGVYPPLPGNPAVTGRDPVTLLHITLSGGRSAQTASRPHVHSMPSFADLPDEQLAQILTFVRQSWGNSASPITPEQVKAERPNFKTVVPRE
jgi:thiosulfate dehydrogenase